MPAKISSDSISEIRESKKIIPQSCFLPFVKISSGKKIVRRFFQNQNLIGCHAEALRLTSSILMNFERLDSIPAFRSARTA